MNKKLIIGLVGAVAVGGFMYFTGGVGKLNERTLSVSTIKNLDFESNSKECEVVSSSYFKDFYSTMGKTEISLNIGFNGRDMTRIVYWGMPDSGTYLLSDGIFIASSSTKEVISLNKDLVAKAPERFKKVCFADFKPDDEVKDRILKNLSENKKEELKEIVFSDEEKNKEKLKRLGFKEVDGKSETGKMIGAFILQNIAK